MSLDLPWFDGDEPAEKPPSGFGHLYDRSHFIEVPHPFNANRMFRLQSEEFLSPTERHLTRVILRSATRVVTTIPFHVAFAEGLPAWEMERLAEQDEPKYRKTMGRIGEWAGIAEHPTDEVWGYWREVELDRGRIAAVAFWAMRVERSLGSKCHVCLGDVTTTKLVTEDGTPYGGFDECTVCGWSL